MKLRICLAAALMATLPSCGTAPPRTPVLTITQILSDPRKFDRQTVIVEGSIRDTGVHGMFATDLHDTRKALNVYIQPEIAWSEPVMAMTRMLLIDRERERRRGVIARFTGTFSWKSDDLSLLSVSRVEKLRWGAE